MKKRMNLLLSAALCAAMLTGAALADTTQVTEVDYAQEDAENHTRIEETWKRTVLEDGELSSGTRIGETETTEAHDFVDGKCTLCEYEQMDAVSSDAKAEILKKDTASSTGAATATDGAADAETAVGPVIRVVAATEAVHGVSADQKPDIVQTLKQVTEDLEPDAQVKLVDVERAFTADEAAAMFRLPARDQALVLLAALGFDAGESLSADAQALLTSIQGHISPEELLKAFPTEIISIDGQDVECYAVTLSYASANGEVLEHYCFRKDDNTLARLTIEE